MGKYNYKGSLRDIVLVRELDASDLG